MYKLVIPKDIASWDSNVEVCITKETVEREWWLLLYEHLGYNVYYIYGPTDSNCIRPWFMFGMYYIFKYIEGLVGINNLYPEVMLEYFKQNNILIPEEFDAVKI